MDLANSLGGPRMLLLPADTIERLGRIPRFSEGYAVDAAETIRKMGPPIVEVFMVSHKWLQSRSDPMDASTGFPDTASNDKAKTISEYTKWRIKWVRHMHQFTPVILYWIDYSCLDQDHLERGVPLMPLWVACCERLLRIDHPEYDSRAWCRLEPLLACAYAFADHQTVISVGFENCWPSTGLKTKRPLLDPRAGHLTDPTDMARILPLIEQAEKALLKNPDVKSYDSGIIYEAGDRAHIKCFVLPSQPEEQDAQHADQAQPRFL
ncbi:expressed unknown protein [Seminavis robusta]|uniref:Heterokaryon incompatibility domain-containing protein n=1 Tax=Seminavis robusta TaxID=568900 RepID=A0A9N8F0A4_9STRA|nr:expressed unknown protein [Seminavis robusta]|eukprot:Sro2338_g323900.1 n/a (265) ;mRNA; r:2954-3748